ncbi:hypothetical protein RHSIM_Rhsim11G0131300 [Rhododendron simsii]|uniref:Uncharacterized protein n=1 Tax=Rhododendron simsii TaxID=118357 RepID=A0A834LA34_RHOSS|nr:hypothetical protein RHSIM_Rhsim11G0131300 [Rhododendron simsii]
MCVSLWILALSSLPLMVCLMEPSPPEVGLYAFSVENKARSLCIFANIFLIPRWRIWRNLDDYTPKHGTRGPQQAGLDDDDANDGSDSGSAPPSSDNCIQLENMNETETSGLVEHSFWNAHVPRRKRSVLEQYVLSPVGWLHRQLYDTLQELEFSNQTLEQEDVLIFQKSQTSSAEIGLGCLLLKPTASSREESKESHS